MRPLRATADASALSPEPILEIAFGYRKSMVLCAAVELGVFETVAREPLDAAALAARVGMHPRSSRDFLDALVAMHLLGRDAQGRYVATPQAVRFLDATSESYLGALVRYQGSRLYRLWASLVDALRDGRPRGGPFAAGGFDAFYADSTASIRFLDGMAAGSLLPARALAERFAWDRYRSFTDIGAAGATVAVEIAARHSHLTGTGFDLPVLRETFVRNARERRLDDRLRFQGGDFLVDPLPPADVLVMGRILHDWGVQVRTRLIAKAHEALAEGGALIVWDALIDEARANAAGLLSSLNMLLQTDAGAEYTASDCVGWMRDAGFADAWTMPLSGPYRAIVAVKGAARRLDATDGPPAAN